MLRAVSSEAKSKGIRVEAGLDGIKLKTRLPAEKSLSRNEVDGIKTITIIQGRVINLYQKLFTL